MTHGEEPGSETPQDSAVLTYLEGLLMHQVAGQPGATATRRAEAERSSQEQGDRAARAPAPLPTQSAGQQDKRTSPGGAPRHFKKARLLHCEAWKEPESQAPGTPVVALNEQGRADRAGRPDSSAQGESTLLASLLQSFSSRLQSAAASSLQHGTQSSKQHEPKQPEAARKDPKEDAGEAASKRQPDFRGNESRQASKETGRNYGAVSCRLKGLMRRGRVQNHSNVPYRRQAGQDGAVQGGGQRSTPDSRATQLKAVASLAKARSSPALSPKPSVACSQLALLLSSEAHLQQYSREQALKAQLSSRAASERLAAMATQKTQDKQQPGTGQPHVTPDTLSSLTSQQGTLPQPGSDSSKQAPTSVPGQSRAHGSPRTPPAFKEKRLFNKHATRPSQNCSSLLLLLLNNHNTQQKNGSEGHLEGDGSVFPVHRSPLLSDSEYSNQENSLTKDSSDAESYYSCCSPIDLSTRSRASGPVLTSPSSSSSTLERLTESLISKWKPENYGLRATEADELKNGPDVKATEKVTLLQLLQDHRDHKNNERLNKFTEHPLRFQHDKLPKPNSMPVGHFMPSALCEETRTRSPAKGIADRNLQSLPTFTHGQDANGSESPHHMYISPHTQSTPLDLCKSKSYPSESTQEPAFSASKLLQNLAQCGTQNTSPSPPLSAPVPPSKRLCKGKELQTDKPVSLLERLNSPVPLSQSPVLDGTHVNRGLRVLDVSPPGSEIENLLERRTVLQLLLGNATSKEKSGGKVSRALDVGCVERQPDKPANCDRFSGPLLDVKVKVEPDEDGQQSEDVGRVKRSRCENGDNLPDSVPHQDVKSEPVFADPCLKDGLLGQLLKQQPRQHHADVQTDVSVGKMYKEHHRPVVPKKRRICVELESHLNGDSCQTLAGRVAYADAGTAGDCSDSRMPERHNVRKPENPQQADLSASCLLSESQPKDGRTFNVLKQLLLSDNCLRDLAQPRGTTNRSGLMAHCKANGNIPLGTCHDFASMQQPSVPRLGTVDLITATSDSPWVYQPRHQDSPVSFKRESEGPIRWTVSGEEKQDSDLDSPRLTKSNPILYYMLQRGHNHLRKGVHGPQGEAEHYEVKVKEEAEVGLKVQDNELKHNLKPHKDKQDKEGEQLNGSLEKC